MTWLLASAVLTVALLWIGGRLVGRKRRQETEGMTRIDLFRRFDEEQQKREE